MIGNGNGGNASDAHHPATRRRTHVKRPRPPPQSVSTNIATEGDRYIADNATYGAAAGAAMMNGSTPNSSPGARHVDANDTGNAPPSPTATNTRSTMGNGNGYDPGKHNGGSRSLSPRSRHLGGDAHAPTSTSRNNKWKRFLFLSVAAFVIIWMSIMTAMVAKLAGEDQSQQQQHQQPEERISDVDIRNNDGNSKQHDITGSGNSGIFGGMASMWQRIRCGRTCWGHTYTYTDPISGKLAVAPLERMQMQHKGSENNFGDGADRRWPRGPVYYATPSMLHYAPQSSSLPRRSALQTQWNRQGTLDSMLRVSPGEEAAPQDHDKQPYVQGDCVPMKEWQVSSFPNCNAFHELNMMGMGRNGTDVAFRHGRGSRSTAKRRWRGGTMYHMEEDAVNFLGRGWFRAAWKVDFGLEESYPVVLKTMRLEREFYDEYYDLHRKDAVAMERLTPSPYVIDIYGFCGQSAINELADFFEDFTNLQAFARQLGGNNDEHLLRLKLQICIMMALGVAHMHEIDGPNNATMVHYDINPKNVAIVKGGKPKLNDFNTVEFLKWNRVKQKRCGFRGRLHEPWWRAPEELIMPKEYAEGKNISSDAIVATFEEQPLLDEKIDVWSLGNLIYNMLTGHAARGQARAWRYAEVRRDVLAAKMPWRPTDAMYLNSTQPAIVAMKRAVERCIVKDPRKRWSALDVAYEMMDALDKILEENEQNGEGDSEGRANGKQGKKKVPADQSAHAKHKR